MWISFTLLAAVMQAWRNALQCQLSNEINVAGVTLARFIWAVPMAALYLAGLYAWHNPGLPQLTPRLVGFILGASLMQILATALMVRLFQMKNFAVGAGLAKSEALLGV